jgi:hypothetical protein
MTPKEKAKELFEWAIKYGASKDVSKLFAIRIVDEIINVVKKYETKKGRLLIDNINLLYWQEVKQEIEDL